MNFNFRLNINKIKSPSLSFLAVAALGLYGFLTISGIFVSVFNAASQCAGWPLCSPVSPIGWFSLVHRIFVGGSTLTFLMLWLQSWRVQRRSIPILTTSTATFVLFLSQALLGSRLGADSPAYYFVLHKVTAIAVWLSSLLAVYFIQTVNMSSDENRMPFVFRFSILRDFLNLTKPIVVALLLVTTFAGMVIGARSWPSFSLTFWTMVGGFMAAGGASAINQYIDRQDDEKMQRTQKRPIPSGRITPAEGLAFGTAMLLGSFYLMVAFVNIVAAVLSLVGMFYYVVLYSLILKKTTVQNIVIGGGAGAIPPLVGWAAATGGLNFPSLFLFAVVFMWTPPHFWALALVKRKDYARANVPMLPVVKGEKETRKQILIYTIELVILTLVLPGLGLGGSIYFVGAVVLGLWLLFTAWKVWRNGGNKLAWKMYRYSSMYLALLFAVLMADALL